MMITCLLNLNSGLSFDDLIMGCTNYNHKKIIGTSVELIVNNVIGQNEMFPKLLDEQEKYAVMFLKSEKYFVVLVDKDGFYLRDCHVDLQKNFKTCNELFECLANFYQFTKMINIDGFQLEDYSSIEFLIFDQQFDSAVMNLLEPQIVSSSNIIQQSTQDTKKIDINKPENQPTTQQNKKAEILNGDIFNVPNKILFSKKDIEYLELLNNELLKGSDIKPDHNILDNSDLVILNDSKSAAVSLKITESLNVSKQTATYIEKPVISEDTHAQLKKLDTTLNSDEMLLLMELQKEIEDYDNDQFAKTLLLDSNHDELVNF